ncbi:MAG: DUF4214 domain-containing protein, partial [Betaproteobacteria bacterium]|nr:DUF4214 domain-containing protein [Betaproteobacteria bacterium]
MAVTAAQRTQVSQFYVALFGRAPDAEGLGYWTGQLDGGTTPQQVANTMFGVAPARGYYPDVTNFNQIIGSFYRNVLGRDADAGGLAYWVGELTAAKGDFGVIVVRMIDIVANYAGTSDPVLNQAGMDSKNLFNNRTSVAQYYGEKGGGLANSTSILGSVTKEAASVAAAKASIDGTQAPPAGTPVAAPALPATAASETAINTNFNDPLYSSQWNLNNSGQRYADDANSTAQQKITAAKAKNGGVLLDINVVDAWKAGFTGKGVVQSVSDDGFDLAHEDIQTNLLKDRAYNGQTKAAGSAAKFDDAGSFAQPAKALQHGTVVGTIAANEANNGKGIVGVAFNSKLIPALILGTQGNPDIAAHLAYLIDQKVDVSLNSYGADPAFSEDYNIAPNTDPANYTDNQKIGVQIARAATEGRNGKGMVLEFSAGNERDTRADSALTNGTSSRYVIAVGSMDEVGNRASYGSRGTNILVSAFGGDGNGSQSVNEGFGIIAGDVRNDDPLNKGYNATDSNGSYSFFNTGTSYSGPTVGAVAALMLQANPNLGFRDVSTILALTARAVGEKGAADQNKYVTTHTTDWNLGGMHHSDEGVGFGLVDATAAVRLAQQWYLADNAATRGTVANWKSIEAASANAAVAIPDAGAMGGAAGVSVTALIAATAQTPNVRIERMEFDIKLTASAPSELKAVVVSPSGTEVVIFDQPLSRDKAKLNDASAQDTAWPGMFTIGSSAFLGENAAGTWTLKLYDTKTGGMADAGYQSFTVRAWGSAVTDDSQYVFTREYTATGKTLTDTAGTDTINAAAVHKAVSINLNAGQASSIGNDSGTPGTFSIAAGSVIENVIGGGGNDTLIGNAANNLLKGSWGSDTISGGAGNDTVAGGEGADNLTGGEGSDWFVITEDSSAATNLFLGDTITDFTAGQDRIQFSSLALSRLAGWTGNTAGLNGAAGAQGAGFFVAGAAATAAYAQLVYNAATGVLALDVDGTGAMAATPLLTLVGSLSLSAADLVF